MELPVEILVDILNFLDVPSLKQCLLVSKTFNNLIFSTPKLMKKFSITLTENTVLEMLNFLKSHGSHLKCLNITDHAYYLIKLIKFLPNISSLKVTDSQYQYQVNQKLMHKIDSLPDIQSYNFSALKDLTIESNNPFVTEQLLHQFYNCKSLKSFKLACRLFDVNEGTKVELLQKFLVRQVDLKHLTLSGMSKSDVIFENFHQMKFRLKKLTIGWDWEKKMENFTGTYQNIRQFLTQQQDHLLELKFGHFGVPDCAIERTKIKLFERMMIECLQDIDMMDVIYGHRHAEHFENINFKALKRLQLWWFDHRIGRLNGCKNIEFLNILYSNLLLDIHQWLKFQNIKHLTIQYYTDITDDFLRFTNLNKEEIFKILQHLKHLQVNTFGYTTVMYTRTKQNAVNVKIYCLATNFSVKVRLDDLRRQFGEIQVEFLKDEEFEKLLSL